MVSIVSKFYDEDGGVGNFVCGGFVKCFKVIFRNSFVDIFIIIIFRSFDYDWKVNFFGFFEIFLLWGDIVFCINVVRDGDNILIIDFDLVYIGFWLGNVRYFCVLCNDCRGNFVIKWMYGGIWWVDENDFFGWGS